MSTQGSSNSSVVTSMVPWLHFVGGDKLFLESWEPSSRGAIAGACFGLALLAFIERWLAATRGVLEAHWRQRALALTSNQDVDLPVAAEKCCDDAEVESEIKYVDTAEDKSKQVTSTTRQPSPRLIAPFIFAYDVPRGVIHALQALLMYLLMLAVMTYQSAYIISIVLALGLGEVIFGRMSRVQTHARH